MESKNYIKDIQMFINEAYSDNEPLQDNQIKSKKVFNDYCNRIKQDLERLEELENDRLLDRAEKEELERVNKVLNHNLEEKVEIIFELENKIQDLELLEALKQRWQQEEWCQGIELSAESLNSLFKYNKDLFDRNLELDKKLAKDELCFEKQYDKFKKAIKILKKKKIDVDELLSCETLQEFNDGYYKKWQLTQQEYDLLCEVFGE